jgi:hypothetical protein
VQLATQWTGAVVRPQPESDRRCSQQWIELFQTRTPGVGWQLRGARLAAERNFTQPEKRPVENATLHHGPP